jgi:hypothetical protein
MARHIMNGDDIAPSPTDLARQTQYPVLFRYLRIYRMQSLSWQINEQNRSPRQLISSNFTNENILANENIIQKTLENRAII